MELGNYLVLQQIGEGGMGEVFLAEHRFMGRRVALKLLRESFSGREEAVRRFFNEATAAARIKHRGIVEVFDCGFGPGGQPFIAMELLHGQSLGAFLRATGPMPAAVALRIGHDVALALAAAHDAGIVHRDLKPENLFLNHVDDVGAADGVEMKVLDFGIAKLAPVAEKAALVATRTGMVLGTAGYMAPEQTSDASKVDRRADIYSLGCVLFEMLAGRPPFAARSFYEQVAAHLTKAAPRLSQVIEGVPPSVDALVNAMMAKGPAERPATMAIVAAALAAALPASGHEGPIRLSIAKPGEPARSGALPYRLATEVIPATSTTLRLPAPAAATAQASPPLAPADAAPLPARRTRTTLSEAVVTLTRGNRARAGDSRRALVFGGIAMASAGVLTIAFLSLVRGTPELERAEPSAATAIPTPRIPPADDRDVRARPPARRPEIPTEPAPSPAETPDAGTRPSAPGEAIPARASSIPVLKKHGDQTPSRREVPTPTRAPARTAPADTPTIDGDGLLPPTFR